MLYNSCNTAAEVLGGEQSADHAYVRGLIS